MMQTTKWMMDPAHSDIEFSVRHMMISTVKGRFKKFKVDFSGDPDNLENGSVRVSIDSQSVDTRDEKRDAHLRSSDFFNTETHKEIVFESGKITKTLDGDYRLSGVLTIRGISRDVELDGVFEGKLKDPYGNERFGVSVKGEIQREDFGVSFNSILETGGVLISSRVKIEAHVELVASKE